MDKRMTRALAYPLSFSGQEEQKKEEEKTDEVNIGNESECGEEDYMR